MIYLGEELSSGLEMVSTKPCLKVCCSTDQTEETSSCHLESDRAVERRQVCRGAHRHPATDGTKDAVQDGAFLGGVELGWGHGREGGTPAGEAVLGEQSSLWLFQALLSAKSQDLSSRTLPLLSLSFFFFICFVFTLALNRLALLQAQNQVAFLLFFSYLASDTAKPNPQGKFNALHIGSLNSKREKKNTKRQKKDPIPTQPNFMG